jgi:hypothetical protein
VCHHEAEAAAGLKFSALVLRHDQQRFPQHLRAELVQMPALPLLRHTGKRLGRPDVRVKESLKLFLLKLTKID